MHVAHVINALPIGGAERFLVQLATAQERLGWRASVVTLVHPNPLAAELARRGIAHLTLGRASLRDPRLVLDLWRALRALRPDVVHTHLFYADVCGRLAGRAAGIGAVIGTEHSTAGGGMSRRRALAARWTAPLADRLVAVSEAVRERTAARLGVAPGRITVVHNGIDLEPWSAAEPLPRAALGLEDGALAVGCVGRLVEAKGYDVLLEALARLDLPRLHVLFAGDGPERASLEARARQLGVASNVRFLGFRDDVPRLLATFDAVAMPSRWEGHSIALLEAMAAGCACVVSDIPELVEIAGDACVHAAPDDPAAWAAALGALLGDAGRRSALGRTARQAVRRYSIEASARRYLELYAEVLGERGRAR